jgi:hypothetical protein
LKKKRTVFVISWKPVQNTFHENSISDHNTNKTREEQIKTYSHSTWHNHNISLMKITLHKTSVMQLKKFHWNQNNNKKNIILKKGK